MQFVMQNHHNSQQSAKRVHISGDIVWGRGQMQLMNLTIWLLRSSFSIRLTWNSLHITLLTLVSPYGEHNLGNIGSSDDCQYLLLKMRLLACYFLDALIFGMGNATHKFKLGSHASLSMHRMRQLMRRCWVVSTTYCNAVWTVFPFMVLATQWHMSPLWLFLGFLSWNPIVKSNQCKLFKDRFSIFSI